MSRKEEEWAPGGPVGSGRCHPCFLWTDSGMTAPATSPDSPATEAKAPPFGEGIALLWGYVRPRLATISLGIFLGRAPGRKHRPRCANEPHPAVSRARLEDIQAFKTGELITRVTSDTVLLREAAATSVVQIVNGTVSLIGTVVLMAVLDLPLLGTTLAALAIITVLFIILMPKIGKADKQAQDAIGEVGAALESGMRALRGQRSSGHPRRSSPGRRRDPPRR